MIVIGALLGFIGIAAGAFGAHSMKGHFSQETLNVFEVAVRYQMYHALALLFCGLMPSATIAGWILFGGTVIFSGSLYLLVFTGVKAWGMITPIGGLILLAGWLTLAIGR